ncbi:hypothetical protein GGX14DRAFT_394095 [Mycena pura]|uniref:Uncharacterized protein n=1 Tax=Mycena pura TaxID=153505 RepID=A0AAD6VF13_9AGAR|nr:hypothetical protein GGX14DRAFT_394095 [Mycena pura]
MAFLHWAGGGGGGVGVVLCAAVSAGREQAKSNKLEREDEGKEQPVKGLRPAATSPPLMGGVPSPWQCAHMQDIQVPSLEYIMLCRETQGCGQHQATEFACGEQMT